MTTCDFCGQDATKTVTLQDGREFAACDQCVTARNALGDLIRLHHLDDGLERLVKVCDQCVIA